MKNKNRIAKIMLVLLVILSIVFLGSNYFFSPVEVDDLSYIDDYNTIKVNFNQDIIINKKTLDGINILDSNGKKMDLTLQLEDSSKNLTIKPSDNEYALGEDYAIVIDSIQGRWFGDIRERYTVSFTIDKIFIDESLGLGQYMTQKISNDRDYEWYVDQGTTGEYSYTNCGPTCAEMIGKWKDENFGGSAEEARSLDYGDDGGWFTENIQNYLDRFNIETEIIGDVTEDLVIDNLNQGNIMVIGIKSDEISFNDSKYGGHVNMVYQMYGGHFILVKGYVVADDVLYFEIYDPNGAYETYEDGTPSGKDRYYRADEVIQASKDWYDSILLVKE
ncbi:cysteine peptidase family C39 domain-containing protein [Clostridium sp. DL1XJH146]